MCLCLKHHLLTLHSDDIGRILCHRSLRNDLHSTDLGLQVLLTLFIPCLDDLQQLVASILNLIIKMLIIYLRTLISALRLSAHQPAAPPRSSRSGSHSSRFAVLDCPDSGGGGSASWSSGAGDCGLLSGAPEPIFKIGN